MVERESLCNVLLQFIIVIDNTSDYLSIFLKLKHKLNFTSRVLLFKNNRINFALYACRVETTLYL